MSEGPPYKNKLTDFARLNFEEIEARVLAHYEKEIGQAVLRAFETQGRSGTVTMRFSFVHDELTIEPVDLERAPCRDPFATVRAKGATAFDLGLPPSACPYLDTRKADGRLTYARAWLKSWHEGYNAAKQRQLDKARPGRMGELYGGK